MANNSERSIPNKADDIDRIEGDTIILNGHGIFPKKLIIIEPGNKREYRLVRTQYGKYQLNR